MDQEMEGEGSGLISRPRGRADPKASRGVLPRATDQLCRFGLDIAYPGQMRESRE